MKKETMNPKVKLGLSAMIAAMAFYGVTSPMLLVNYLGIREPHFFTVAVALLFLGGVFLAAWALGFAVEAIRDIWQQSPSRKGNGPNN
jgi:hypothetical protein